jgi:hypothetical protein
MKKKSIKIKIELQEEILGTASSQHDLHDQFIGSKAPDAKSREEEVEALGPEEVAKKAMTIFARDADGNPFLWDYMIKGFMKDACKSMRRVPGSCSSKLTAYKQVIDGLIFPSPRRIPLILPEGSEMGKCQRPLRAQTAQGERIAIASSETVPEGATLEIDIRYYPMTKKKGAPTIEECIEEWFEYGSDRGLGQWRNSGKGRFEWELIEDAA